MENLVTLKLMANRIKPITRGMWSNWHKTRAKLTHTQLDIGLTVPNIIRGTRYVWHYFKYHTWLEKRRFNLKTAAVIKPARNYFTWSAKRKKKTNKLR